MKIILIIAAMVVALILMTALAEAKAFDSLENNAIVEASKSQGTRIPYKNGLYAGPYDSSRTLK